MNEKKKLITILVIAVAFIALIIGVNIASNQENQKTVDQYEKLLNSKTEELIFIGRPTCSYCEQLMPVLEEITGLYKVDYKYMNTDDLNSGTTDKLLKLFNTDSSTPQLLIVKNGKVVKTQQGYTDREGLFKFLQEGNLIKKDEVLEANDSHLKKIDYKKYDEYVYSKENKIIVIAQTGCSYCESAKPVLNALAKENEMEINWLNITELSEEDQTKVIQSFEIFNEDFGTPLIMIVRNGKVIDSVQGYENKDKYVEFFKKNEFIK